MDKKRIVALATVFVLIGAGVGAAVYMVISNTIDYEVIVEGDAITLTEVTGPSGPLTRGVNHTFHTTMTVNAGSWQCNFDINITSQLITDDTLMDNVEVYVNDTYASLIWSASDPNTYIADHLIGIVSPGTYELYWSISFDFEMPVGAYGLILYVWGEAR